MSDVEPVTWPHEGGGFPAQFVNSPQPDNEGDRITIEAVDNRGRLHQVINANLTGVDYKWSAPDAATFTASPLDRSVQYLPLKTRNFEIRIRIPNENEPFWGEPTSVSGGPSGLSFQCMSLLSIFGQRFIDRASLELTSVPQAQIMEALIRYAQSEARQAFRDWNIQPRAFDYAGDILGKLRSRQYWREEHAQILDALNEFAHLDHAITLKMTYIEPASEIFYGKAGIWKRYLDLIPVYDVVHPLSVPLVYGISDEPSNISSFTYAESAEDLVNHVYATGGSAGDIKFEENYIDQVSASIHGVRQGIVSHGDMTDPAWLKAAAKKEVDDRKSPKQVITVTIPDRGNAIGRYAWIGTVWPVRIDYGRIQVNGNFRIVGRKVNANGTFTLSMEQIMKPLKRPDQVFLSWPS